MRCLCELSSGRLRCASSLLGGCPQCASTHTQLIDSGNFSDIIDVKAFPSEKRCRNGYQDCPGPEKLPNRMSRFLIPEKLPQWILRFSCCRRAETWVSTFSGSRKAAIFNNTIFYLRKNCPNGCPGALIP